MKNFFLQTTINFKRIVLRNLRLLIFSILIPIGFYLLFTQVMTPDLSPDALHSWKIDYLISMIVYSSLLSAIFTVANTLLEDHLRKFDLFVTLSPLSKYRYYLSMGVVFMAMNVLAASALTTVAVFVNHLSLSLTDLGLLCLVAPLLSLPLFLLGILVSLAGTANVVNLLSNLLVFPMAIFSGLWWPLDTMHHWVQQVGSWLPTYHAAQILKEAIQPTYFHFSHFGVLLLWGIAFALILSNISKRLAQHEVQTI